MHWWQPRYGPSWWMLMETSDPIHTWPPRNPKAEVVFADLCYETQQHLHHLWISLGLTVSASTNCIQAVLMQMQIKPCSRVRSCVHSGTFGFCANHRNCHSRGESSTLKTFLHLKMARFMPPCFSEVTHVICHSIHGIVMVDLTLLLILTGCRQSQAGTWVQKQAKLYCVQMKFSFPILSAFSRLRPKRLMSPLSFTSWGERESITYQRGIISLHLLGNTCSAALSPCLTLQNFPTRNQTTPRMTKYLRTHHIWWRKCRTWLVVSNASLPQVVLLVNFWGSMYTNAKQQAANNNKQHTPTTRSMATTTTTTNNNNQQKINK